MWLWYWGWRWALTCLFIQILCRQSTTCHCLYLLSSQYYDTRQQRPTLNTCSNCNWFQTVFKIWVNWHKIAEGQRTSVFRLSIQEVSYHSQLASIWLCTLCNVHPICNFTWLHYHFVLLIIACIFTSSMNLFLLCPS